MPDSYVQVAVGGQQQFRVSNRLSVFAGADLDLRANQRERAYDIASGGINAGFSQLTSAALWRTTLAYSVLGVGANRYRDTLSLGLDATITLGADQSLVAFAQYGEMTHAVSDEIRDARATTLGAMFTQGLPDIAMSPSVGARLSYTQEDNARLRVDLSKKMPLLRIFGSLNPMDRLRVSLGLSIYQQQYGGEDVGFGSVRRDKAWSADLVASYAISPTLSLRADAVWSGTQSNQDLYDSHRNAASLKLRYQF